MIKYAIGNIIDYAMNNHSVVALQGCNCWNRMGRGLAAEVAKRIPQAVKVDQQTIKGHKGKLGSWTRVDLANGAVWLNAYTQYHWHERRNNEPVLDNGKTLLFDKVAFTKVCAKLRAEFPLDHELVFPLIGCGLAHGTWSEVEEIIQRDLVDLGYKVRVLIFNESQIPEGVTINA